MPYFSIRFPFFVEVTFPLSYVCAQNNIQDLSIVRIKEFAYRNQSIDVNDEIMRFFCERGLRINSFILHTYIFYT